MPLIICTHPDQVTEWEARPGRWHRYLHGRRWRTRFVAGSTVCVLSCPACPSRLYQVEGGMPMHHQMPPWLLEVHL